MSGNFEYYSVKFKLLTPMQGTATATDIYYEHVLQKNKKEIERVNRLMAKFQAEGKKNRKNKDVEKYGGVDQVSEKKTVEELKGAARAFMPIIGEERELPDDVDGILEVWNELMEVYKEQQKNKDEMRALVFLKDENGWPIISSHMVLGNLKQNLKVITNNGDKSIVKSKVAVGEVLSLDVKWIEPFMRPDKDIIKDENGERKLSIKPIRFTNKMGKEETAISLAEELPEGTVFGCTLRVRKDSPFTEKALEKLFDLGKNCGLGAWRGSGGKGSYVFKLEKLKDYVEVFEDGWK